MMKKYLEYKESIISWLGNIPKHWNVFSFSQCAKEQNISNKNIHHQNLLSLSYGKIIRKDINRTEGLVPKSYDNYQLVNDGDIVLRLTDLQNDKKSLRTGLATETGIVTSAYLALHCFSHVFPAFFHYILHVYDVRKLFYSMGGGLRQSCSYDDLKFLQFYMPSYDEQKIIANYLDSKISEIDELIKDKEKEIILLKEYKESLISDVVTGKVDVRDFAAPNVKEYG